MAYVHKEQIYKQGNSLFLLASSYPGLFFYKKYNCIQLQGRDCSLCLVADDSVFLPLLVAHLSETSHVISLFPGLGRKGLQYLQAVSQVNGLSRDRIEVLEKRVKYLTVHDTHQKKVEFPCSTCLLCYVNSLNTCSLQLNFKFLCMCVHL